MLKKDALKTELCVTHQNFAQSRQTLLLLLLIAIKEGIHNRTLRHLLLILLELCVTDQHHAQS